MTNQVAHPQQKTRPTSHVWLALLLFLLALIPRLPGLNRFLTSDENTNIFFAGSDVIAAFLQGDLRGTYWHFYPGVTMSWLDAVGMSGQYFFERIIGTPVPPFSQYIYGDILSLVVANRVPYALLSAAAIPAIYLLARKLLPHKVALLGALFLAFDPFYLAHSRVAHGDMPVAVFMSLSALCFFIYAQQIAIGDWSTLPNPKPEKSVVRPFIKPYLIASAVLGSLAALTKAPGQFMALFIIGMSILYALQQARYATTLQKPSTANNPSPHLPTPPSPIPNPQSLKSIITHWLLVIITWGFISLAVFVFIWPSMWVDPVGTFRQMWGETFGKVNEGHLVYFFGQPTLDPGPWFYSYVIPFRLTPIIFIGALLSLLFFIPAVKKISNLQSPISQSPSPLLLLWLFTITLLIFGNLSPKKQDRYLLPLFPFLNLIAAIGWIGTLNLIFYTLKSQFPSPQSPTRTERSRSISNLLISFIFILHLIPSLTYYPYYLTYFNPLMGGPSRAAEITLMGWGEGMEQVAAYLNHKPNATELYVASTPSQTLLPYFVGTGENFYTNDIAFRADYVVLYLAQMQRLAPSPEIVHYFESQEPEKTITIQNVPYAYIYPGPKFIVTDIPPTATPANIGLDNFLRLAGYQLPNLQLILSEAEVSPPLQPNSGQATNPLKPGSITLYWHALAPIADNYTVSVRAKTADGQILTQQDQWPVAGLLPTSQWRQGDYIIDTHTFDLSDPDQLTTFEVVLYNANTGQTLGPPITIVNEQLSMKNEQ